MDNRNSNMKIKITSNKYANLDTKLSEFKKSLKLKLDETVENELNILLELEEDVVVVVCVEEGEFMLTAIIRIMITKNTNTKLYRFNDMYVELSVSVM